MGELPSKAAELEALCLALRQASVVFFLTTEGARRKGGPDLVVSAGTTVAVWVRRSELSMPLSPAQLAEMDRVAAAGWTPMVAYGARQALRDLERRASRRGNVYDFAPTSQCG